MTWGRFWGHSGSWGHGSGGGFGHSNAWFGSGGGTSYGNGGVSDSHCGKWYQSNHSDHHHDGGGHNHWGKGKWWKDHDNQHGRHCRDEDRDDDKDDDQDDGGDTAKPTLSFTVGEDDQLTIDIVQDGDNQLFFNITPTDSGADLADIDGVFFNLTDDSQIDDLGVSPEDGTLPVTGHQLDANSANTLDNGVSVSEDFDAAVQFGQVPDSTEGEVTSASFTLYAYPGTLSLEDIDTSKFAIVVNSDSASPEVLTGGTDDADSDYDAGGVADADIDCWTADEKDDSTDVTDSGNGHGRFWDLLTGGKSCQQDEDTAAQQDEEESDDAHGWHSWF